MIEISSTVALPKSFVEFDEYIPAVVRWSTPGRSAPFYYRICGAGGQLVEVGLDPDTLSICKLGVIIISAFDVGVELFRGDVACRGLPTVERDPSWVEPLDYTDVNLPIRVSFLAPSLYVSFVEGGNQDVHAVLDAGPVKFAVNSARSLVGVSVELPEGDHYVRLREILEH
ncbi:MAG: hypothetical protein GY722_05200 [bacterium]|nr:hypothetical protein [bacterium]